MLRVWLAHPSRVLAACSQGLPVHLVQDRRSLVRCGTFRKQGVPYFAVLTIRILLFRVLY